MCIDTKTIFHFNHVWGPVNRIHAFHSIRIFFFELIIYEARLIEPNEKKHEKNGQRKIECEKKKHGAESSSWHSFNFYVNRMSAVL